MTKLSLGIFSSIAACMTLSLTYADTNPPIPTNICDQTPPAYNIKCSSTMQTNFFTYYYQHAFNISNLSDSDYANNLTKKQPIYNDNNFTASNPKFIIKPLATTSNKKKANTTIKWF